jgi:hypothetical protein
MTLDRIDNTIGHVKTNVKPACIRCNLLRRNMPYAAWLMLVPAVKKARKFGLFDGWLFQISGNQSFRPLVS